MLRALARAGVVAWGLIGVPAPASATIAGVIDVDHDMVRDARFATGPTERSALLLRDGSTVTLGPGTALTIDRFVFDRATRRSRLALSVTTGTLRIDAGRAIRDQPMTLDTPTARIEIRSPVTLITVSPQVTEATPMVGHDTVATSKSTGERAIAPAPADTLRIAAQQPIVATHIDAGRLAELLADLDGNADRRHRVGG